MVSFGIDQDSLKAYLAVDSTASLAVMIETVYSSIVLAVMGKITEETLVIVIVLHLQT